MLRGTPQSITEIRSEPFISVLTPLPDAEAVTGLGLMFQSGILRCTLGDVRCDATLRVEWLLPSIMVVTISYI